MAVILSFSICQDSSCKELSFKEETGAYSATNIVGWGAPNRATSTATEATLTITDPDGNDYTIDLFATGDFPTTDDTLEYSIDFTDIGLTTGDSLPDGIYTFLYSVTTVSGTTVVYTQTIRQAFYCQVQCCVYSMFKDLDLECDCSKDQKEKAINAYLLLKGLIYSSGCGNIQNFNTDLEVLNRLCLNSHCSNCK